MTIASSDEKPIAGFHDTLDRVDHVMQFVTPQGRTLELYERIDGAYVKIAEYGAGDESR